MRLPTTVAVLSFAFLLGTPALAFGPEPVHPPPSVAASPSVNAEARNVNAQLAEVAQWSGAYLRLLNGVVAPLQGIPPVPDDSFNNAQRHAWADQVRTWAQATQATMAATSEQARNLPPPPDVPLLTPELRAGMVDAPQNVLRLTSAIDDIARNYVQLADAFERRQNGALISIRLNVVDSIVLGLTVFRDVNAASAASLESTHPQHALLLSCTRSYDAMIALVQFKRAYLTSATVDRAAAAASIEALAQEMRTYATVGRAAAHSLLADIAAHPVDPSASEAVSLVTRVSGMLRTYDASFDRELSIAEELVAIAALIRDPRDFAEVESEIDRHSEVIGNLDNGRMDETRQRQALMSR